MWPVSLQPYNGCWKQQKSGQQEETQEERNPWTQMKQIINLPEIKVLTIPNTKFIMNKKLKVA